MQPVRARVKNGRLVLDEPTDLLEGDVVELVPLGEALAHASEIEVSTVDDDPTDEPALNVGGDLPPEVMYRPITEGEAEAVRHVLAHPPAPTAALRKLVRRR